MLFPLLTVRRSPGQDCLGHAGPGVRAHILSAVGVDRIAFAGIEKVGVADKTVRLDAEDALFYSGDSDAINAYRGEYMSSYSWASMTEAILSWKTTNR